MDEASIRLMRATLNTVVRKVVAWLPMYACYYVGELAFQIVNRWPEGWSEEDGSLWDRIGSAFYRIYSTGMWWSCKINDWAGFKLWYVDEEEKRKYG